MFVNHFIGVSCGVMEEIPGGVWIPDNCSTTSVHYPDACIYACDDGYTNLGSEALQCSANGSFVFDVMPFCGG